MSIDSMSQLLASSQVFDLEHDRYMGAPIFPAHWPGYVYSLHRHHEVVDGQSRTSASGTIYMAEHSGTHIDALSHQARDMEMFGGVPVNSKTQTDHGFSELGVETIAPILKRGVLLDVAALKGVEKLDAGYLITADDLEDTAAKFGVTIRQGDCVLIRTGWGQEFHDSVGYLKAAGIGADGARWLAKSQPYLCGADNMAVDVPENIDAELGALPCHSVLIVQNGIYIVENLNLQGLSAAKKYEFLFICLPLKMRGVTGSPVRPVAIC